VRSTQDWRESGSLGEILLVKAYFDMIFLISLVLRKE